MVKEMHYGGTLAQQKSKVQISPGQIPLGSPIPQKQIYGASPKRLTAPVAGAVRAHLDLFGGRG